MGNVLEGKISLICLIHYPELVTTKPLVEEVDRGDDLQLTSASIVCLRSPACVPSGAARHLKWTRLPFMFVVWPQDRADFDWDSAEAHTGKLSSTKGSSQGSPSAAKTVRNKFCIDFQPGPVPFTPILKFPFRLFRSLILYWSFLYKRKCNLIAQTRWAETRTWCCIWHTGKPLC